MDELVCGRKVTVVGSLDTEDVLESDANVQLQRFVRCFSQLSDERWGGLVSEASFAEGLVQLDAGFIDIPVEAEEVLDHGLENNTADTSEWIGNGVGEATTDVLFQDVIDAEARYVLRAENEDVVGVELRANEANHSRYGTQFDGFAE